MTEISGQKCATCWVQKNCWEGKPVIHLFGASGSGTTTLGRALVERLNLRHMDTDDYFWLPTDPPFARKRPIPERLSLMQDDLVHSSGAVISGSLVDWGDPLTAQFTLAVRVVTDSELRLRRLHARELARFGSRILEGGDMYGAHQDFLRWAAGYDAGDVTMRSRAKHDLWQQDLPCPVLTVDGGRPLAELVEQVLDALRGMHPPVSAPKMQQTKIDARRLWDRLCPKEC